MATRPIVIRVKGSDVEAYHHDKDPGTREEIRRRVLSQVRVF